jgi:hypothetical protein
MASRAEWVYGSRTAQKAAPTLPVSFIYLCVIISWVYRRVMAHRRFSTPSFRPKGFHSRAGVRSSGARPGSPAHRPPCPVPVFILACVLAYMWLEACASRRLFWVAHPHTIDYLHVGTATKYFPLLVSIGIFAFAIWFAERILLRLSVAKDGGLEIHDQ